MSDRVLRWYIEGNISRTKTEVGGTYRLDADYTPTQVNLSARIVGTGSPSLEVDILDDGVSIFSDRPALLGMTETTWTTIPANVMQEGSLITLDISGVDAESHSRDLTVELELQK